jgi:HEPN domain-containing protein
MREMPEEKYAGWLREAETQLKAAVALKEGGFHSLACFLSQQVFELALKAFLLHEGEDLVKIHSLVELVDLCKRYEAGFSRFNDAARDLEHYYVFTRYPNGIGTGAPSDYFNERQSREALAAAEAVLAFVKERI